MIKTIVTHSEVFHTDEIFAVAYLLLTNQGAKVIRTREVTAEMEENPEIALVDVSRKTSPATMRYNPKLNNFDHHMNYHPTNAKSAFGLVVDAYNHKNEHSYIYKVYGKVIGEFVYNNFMKNLVTAIDKWDIGEIRSIDVPNDVVPIQVAFRWLNQDLTESETQHHSFMVAVYMAQQFIKGALNSAFRVHESIEIWTNRTVINEHVCSLDAFCMVWQKENSKLERPFKFALFPQDDNTYVVIAYNSKVHPLVKPDVDDIIHFDEKDKPFIGKFKSYNSAVRCAIKSSENVKHR